MVSITLLVAMALRILPLSHPLAAVNPDWVLLLLIYWILAAPESVGLGTAWFTGFLADVLTGRSLGQHALAYCLVGYCCLRFHNRLRFYPLLQQSLCVGLFLLLSQLIVAWTQESSGRPIDVLFYGMPPLSGVLVWPLVMHLMHRMRSVSDSP